MIKMERLSIFKDYFYNARRNIILNSYYTEKMKDGKSMKASFLDWIFMTMLVTLFFLITIFNSIKDIISSIILTLILMLVYLFVLITLKNRTRIKKMDIINENIAEEEIHKGIDKYGNDDFLLYIKNGLIFFPIGILMFIVVRLIGYFFGQSLFTVIMQIVIGACVYLTISILYLIKNRDSVPIDLLSSFINRRETDK